MKPQVNLQQKLARKERIPDWVVVQLLFTTAVAILIAPIVVVPTYTLDWNWSSTLITWLILTSVGSLWLLGWLIAVGEVWRQT